MSGERIVVVLATAREASLGRHLCELVVSELRAGGAQVELQDLLREGFDPVLRLARGEEHASEPREEDDPLAARYAREVRECDALVVVHPVWWFQAPALLKGWVDRILVHGVAIEQQSNGAPRGLLGGKQLLVVQTFNSSAAIDRVLFGGASAFFWKRIVGVATGMRRVRRLALYGVLKLGSGELVRFERRLRKAAAGLLS